MSLLVLTSSSSVAVLGKSSIKDRKSDVTGSTVQPLHFVVDDHIVIPEPPCVVCLTVRPRHSFVSCREACVQNEVL